MSDKHNIRVMDHAVIEGAIKRIAHEIIERNRQHIGQVAIVGIRTRGEWIARRVAGTIETLSSVVPAQGVLDITLYRDDIMTANAQPIVHETNISFDVSLKHIVLVDDVLFTGRTIRAALDAFIDFGRPQSIQLAVLVDRGHRELPIKADYVGKNVPTAQTQAVQVRLEEIDGEDGVLVTEQD